MRAHSKELYQPNGQSAKNRCKVLKTKQNKKQKKNERDIHSHREEEGKHLKAGELVSLKKITFHRILQKNEDVET